MVPGLRVGERAPSSPSVQWELPSADGSNPSTAPSNVKKCNSAAPHDVSITLVAAAALLSPLATVLLWSLQANNRDDDDFDIHHRHMEIVCDVNVTSAALEKEEVSTVDAILTTTIISSSVALLCLLGYELFRRDPIVGKYVYDRKRLTQPDRSPPPLMLSRSLWRGDEEGRRSCCQVRPAILEFIYINLDKIYIRYTEAADEARQEREKRGYISCCRTGCYHNNCCNQFQLENSCAADSDGCNGGFVDEDGYFFYQGYQNDYSHIYQGNNRSFSPQKKPQKVTQLMEAQETDSALSPKWKRTIVDLFPEDDVPRDTLATHVDEHTNSDDSQNEGNTSGFDGSLGSVSFQTANSFEANEAEEGKQMTLQATNSDVNKKSIEGQPASTGIGDNLQADGVLGEDTALDTATKVGEGPNASCNAANGERDSGTQQSLRYPHRLKYLFMPPGFHTWENFGRFLGHFFFVSRLFPSMPFFGDCDDNQKSGRDLLANPGKDLTDGEKKLLEYAGIDTYLLIRSARFGFDVTNYPFWAACVVILPIYYSSEIQTNPAYSGSYLDLTINQIPDGSPKMIPVVIFTILLYLYILRRLWLEWEVFIKIRHDFLANGDKSFYKGKKAYQEKYRNTCLVECVPKTHRSDENIRLFFDRLFPGQIEHAEMMIDTSKLEGILRERRQLIEKYDDIDARFRYEQWVYSVWERKGKLVGCCNTKISKPVDPKIRTRLCPREKEDAFPHYNKKITEIDELADSEYVNIVELRQKYSRTSLVRLSEHENTGNNTSQFSAHDMYQLFVPSRVRKLFGEQADFFYGTGVVTFKTIAQKQSAVQCNISGLPYFMITNDAPDPRDLFWSNVGVDRITLENRKILVQFLLLVGVLAWGTIVSLIHAFTLQTIGSIPFGGIGATFVQGYLPALVVSLILLWIPNLFFILARRVIRFKSHTQCDEFVLIWNTAYRLANIFFTFFSISLFQAMQCLRENPEDFVVTLADGIIRQSAFLMNLIILATGQETMLQLLQWRSLIKQAVFRPLINLNARSRRYLDWLNAPPEFEKSFIFGFFAPVLSYGLMIAMVFAFLAPIMLGVCAIFFWVATKVHTHNALFVYCQRCEGGGKIFYYWSRIVFITLYSSILVFSGILALKMYTTLGIVFFFVMVLVTYCVDRAVNNTFVVHSLHLPISIARIHDDEEAAHLLEETNAESGGLGDSTITKPGGGEKFMYRHPILNQDNWNLKPTWS